MNLQGRYSRQLRFKENSLYGISCILLFINRQHNDYIITRIYYFICYAYILQPANEMTHEQLMTLHQETKRNSLVASLSRHMCYVMRAYDDVLLKVFIQMSLDFDFRFLFLFVITELFPNSVFQLYCPRVIKSRSTLPVTVITEIMNCN